MAEKQPVWDVEPSEDGKYWTTQNGKRIKAFSKLTDAELHIKNMIKTPEKSTNMSQKQQLEYLEKQLEGKKF